MMVLPPVISGLGEVVSALLRRDGREDLADGVADGVDGSLAGFAQEVLELGEELFDGVEVGSISAGRTEVVGKFGQRAKLEILL